MNLKEKKNNKNKKVIKQLEQEQNQRNGDHTKGFQWGRGREEWGEKVQGRRSIISRHKVHWDRQKMVQETDNSKNFYVQPTDMN